MPVKMIETNLPGVVIIESDLYTDQRGFFRELYNRKKYEEAGFTRHFVQDNHSHSKKGVLRGLHYQLKQQQGKLVTVITGEIYDVAVDIRKGSPTFGKWMGVHLSDKENKQLFIPEGFAHGFCVLTQTADVHYKCTDLHLQGGGYGVLWSDPGVGIEWPISDVLVSRKDQNAPLLEDIPQVHLPDYKG